VGFGGFCLRDFVGFLRDFAGQAILTALSENVYICDEAQHAYVFEAAQHAYI
jgi:hypothetical protein